MQQEGHSSYKKLAAGRPVKQNHKEQQQQQQCM